MRGFVHVDRTDNYNILRDSKALLFKYIIDRLCFFREFAANQTL